MARRYSQIKRGAEYNQALDNYLLYLRDAQTRPTKRLQGGARGARRKLEVRYVKPFGMAIGADEMFEVRASADSLTEIGSAVGSRITTATPSTKILINKKFKPARVSAFKGSGNATYVQSKVTKLYYLKYEGDSSSLPFGALTEVEEEQTGANAVRQAIITLFGAADIKRISFSAEKVPA